MAKIRTEHPYYHCTRYANFLMRSLLLAHYLLFPQKNFIQRCIEPLATIIWIFQIFIRGGNGVGQVPRRQVRFCGLVQLMQIFVTAGHSSAWLGVSKWYALSIRVVSSCLNTNYRRRNYQQKGIVKRVGWGLMERMKNWEQDSVSMVSKRLGMPLVDGEQGMGVYS